MKNAFTPQLSASNRSGAVLLLMLLVIVVVGTIIWLDPSALFNRPDRALPWNQEDRILGRDEKVHQMPSSDQPDISAGIMFSAKVKPEHNTNAKPCGKIGVSIFPDGKIKGGWSAEYFPEPKINYLVMSASFTGNIDATKIYEDKDGEDSTKLYFITKDKFMILETREETGKVRNVSGHIYVTGWIDPEYNVTGKLIITSDKRNAKVYSWFAKADTQKTMFELPGDFMKN